MERFSHPVNDFVNLKPAHEVTLKLYGLEEHSNSDRKARISKFTK